MKSTLFLAYLCLTIFPLSLVAQKDLPNGLVFSEFKEGIVTYKNQSKSKALLNYDSVVEQMLFINTVDSTVLAVDNPEQITFIEIDKRRFFPIEKSAFYEGIQAGNGFYYIQWKSKIISVGKGTAYGGYSATSSITNVKSLNGANVVQLKSNEKLATKTDKIFYLKDGSKFKKFFSAKTLSKLFKGHEQEIENFAKDQAIDFNSVEDVTRIVTYGYELK